MNKSNVFLALAKAIVWVMTMICVMWFFASWFNVVTTNSNPETSGMLWTWNLFTILFG